MTDHEPAVLICMPAAQLIGAPIDGSILRDCDDCTRLIWIGPVEKAIAALGHFDAVICPECGRRRVEAERDREPF